jgi:surface carbohydrate biosynthesis protein
LNPSGQPVLIADRKAVRVDTPPEEKNMKSFANIKNTKACLVIPVENQVRELDPKLLLACIAVQRGFAVIIGSHREVDFRITSFPRSLYLNKSMTERNIKMFRIMEKIGHEILTWDEEALVHLPPETYYSRRLSPIAIRYNSHLFAWGEDNAELWRQYPDLPADMPIHVTGNPRSDMLRPELQPFYKSQVEEIQKTCGKFILVNTNFNHVNAFFPAQNLFRPVKKTGETPQFGKAAVGMSREYAEGLRDHKQRIFNAFKELIPILDRSYPNHMIIVRPHPTENQQVYKDIAAGCQRVKVTNEGNVVPWLMATDVVIHNGCTTGVEAYMMGVPAVSYRAEINETYDMGFYRLPNLISYQCFDVDQLQQTLTKIFKGELGPANGDDRQALVKHYLAAQDGPLACERIVDVLEKKMAHQPVLPKPFLSDRLIGRGFAHWRRLVKYVRKHIPGKHAPPEFHRHRYPGISLQELIGRISKIQQVLGDSRNIKAESISDQIFLMTP